MLRDRRFRGPARLLCRHQTLDVKRTCFLVGRALDRRSGIFPFVLLCVLQKPWQANAGGHIASSVSPTEGQRGWQTGMSAPPSARHCGPTCGTGRCVAKCIATVAFCDSSSGKVRGHRCTWAYVVRVRAAGAGGGRASRTLPEAAGEDQEIAEPDGAVAVQVEPRVVPGVSLAQAELRRELQKVGKSDRPVAVEIGVIVSDTLEYRTGVSSCITTRSSFSME